MRSQAASLGGGNSSAGRHTTTAAPGAQGLGSQQEAEEEEEEAEAGTGVNGYNGHVAGHAASSTQGGIWGNGDNGRQAWSSHPATDVWPEPSLEPDLSPAKERLAGRGWEVSQGERLHMLVNGGGDGAGANAGAESGVAEGAWADGRLGERGHQLQMQVLQQQLEAMQLRLEQADRQAEQTR